jgi:hypothetical protein
VEELDEFQKRFANVLGPFGYKFREQFAELNHYYDTANTGIGRHGDVERGHPGAVNCLKVGEKIPLLFSWYKDTKPVGKHQGQGLPEPPHRLVTFPIVTFKKPKWAEPTKTAAAVIEAGDGAVYMMSGEAIGQNWKQRDYALRHCAGAPKYTGLPRGGRYGTKKGKAYSITFSDQVENDSESPELQFPSRWLSFASTALQGKEEDPVSPVQRCKAKKKIKRKRLMEAMEKVHEGAQGKESRVNKVERRGSPIRKKVENTVGFYPTDSLRL